MSGGYFDYEQYKILMIAEHVKDLVAANERYQYKPETVAEFKNAIALLEKAYVYVHRIDWLHCGDDDEDSFHQRLKQELEKLNGQTEVK